MHPRFEHDRCLLSSRTWSNLDLFYSAYYMGPILGGPLSFTYKFPLFSSWKDFLLSGFIYSSWDYSLIL